MEHSSQVNHFGVGREKPPSEELRSYEAQPAPERHMVSKQAHPNAAEARTSMTSSIALTSPNTTLVLFDSKQFQSHAYILNGVVVHCWEATSRHQTPRTTRAYEGSHSRLPH